MSSFLEEEFNLKKNPFPPAASSIEEKDVFVPESWEEKVSSFYEILSNGEGAKAFPVIGEYGTGKTAFLKGYLNAYFREKNLLPFYFENPGTQFYDLANELFRNLGRYEFTKAIWELIRSYLPQGSQTTLFEDDYPKFLQKLKTKTDRDIKACEIQQALMNGIDIIDDEEVAFRIATMIVETGKKPYFQYKDFIAGKKDSVVAERKEDKFFSAIIQLIMKIYNVEGIVFLIDEFEDVALNKRMPKNKAYEYLATLRNLIDISDKYNLWIIMAMTPQAAEITTEMNPALWDRFTHEKSKTIILEPFSLKDSNKLFEKRLSKSRMRDLDPTISSIFPFTENYLNILEKRPDLRVARKLIKIGFFSLSYAENTKHKAPLNSEFLESILSEYIKSF